MKILRALLIFIAAYFLAAAPALAGSSPNWTYGYVPTTAEWNLWWSKKFDDTGTTYCAIPGCTMTGPLLTVASSTLAAGLNLAPGVAPSTPNNGDLWVTATGIFVRYGGSTFQLASGGTSIPSGTTGQILVYTGATTLAGSNNFTYTSAAGLAVLSNSSAAIGVGPNGATNATFQVDASTASAVTGVLVKGTTAGGGATLSSISTATDEFLQLSGKGVRGVNSISTFYATNNTPSFPATTGANAGLAITWNHSSGNAEVDFWNTYLSVPALSYAFYQMTAASAATLLFSISNSFVSANEAILGLGTTMPTQSAGYTGVLGSVAAPTLTATSQGYFYNAPTGGAVLQGDGSTYDVVLLNKNAGIAFGILTGTTQPAMPGLGSVTCANSVIINASGGLGTGVCPAAAASITVGGTTIASGTSPNVLYNNAGVLGNAAVNGGLAAISGGNLQLDPGYTGFANAGCTITASVTSNNVTVNLLNGAGSTPTTAAPCYVNTRSATLSSGGDVSVIVSGPVSFTANAGSTFGVANSSASCRAGTSCPFKLWVMALNNAGSIVLGVANLTNASGVDPLNEGTLISSTACASCTTATAVGTVYSTAAQTNLPWKYLGYLEWGSGLATAGSYASAPTAIANMSPGMKKPGDVIQRQLCCIGNVTTVAPSGTSFATGTNTNITAAIVPTMASNLIRTSYAFTISTGGAVQTSGICQNSVAGPTAIGPVAKVYTNAASSGGPGQAAWSSYDTPGVTSSITYVARCWVNAGTGATVPAVNTDGGYEEIVEIMG